jgi:hypothetical protein
MESSPPVGTRWVRNGVDGVCGFHLGRRARAAVQVQSSAVNRGAPTWDWWNLTEHEKASRRIATEESHPSHFCLITMSLTLLFGDGDVHLNLWPKIAVSRRQPRAPFIRPMS